jgi:hypothetical protein
MGRSFLKSLQVQRQTSMCSRHPSPHIELPSPPPFQTPMEEPKKNNDRGKMYAIVQNWKGIPPTYQTLQGILIKIEISRIMMTWVWEKDLTSFNTHRWESLYGEVLHQNPTILPSWLWQRQQTKINPWKVRRSSSSSSPSILQVLGVGCIQAREPPGVLFGAGTEKTLLRRRCEGITQLSSRGKKLFHMKVKLLSPESPRTAGSWSFSFKSTFPQDQCKPVVFQALG